jgi:hypothetical protein
MSSSPMASVPRESKVTSLSKLAGHDARNP